MRPISAAALMLLIGSASISCDERDSITGPSNAPTPIGGRVTDFVSQQATAGAVVQYVTSGDVTTDATTDASGAYSLTVPATGVFQVRVSGIGVGTARVNGRGYPGDLFVHGGTCRSRYGIIIEATTLRPIAGATVTLGGVTARSGGDGWYRIDLDCPPTNQFGNTTFIYATHRNYEGFQQVVGRGIQFVQRLDIAMQRK